MYVTLPSKEKILLEDEIFHIAEQDYYKNGVPGCSKEVHVQTFISGYCLALQKSTQPVTSTIYPYDQMK